MTPITPQDPTIIEVAGGVDTHQDTHTAAVIDQVGRVLGTECFPADPAGYATLLAWMRSFGRLVRVGVEGTGAYGAGLARLLRDEHVEVVEVDRPNRKTRRFQGKSDPIDAIAAAKAALAGDRTGTPKQRDGRIEALRNLRVARRSAVDQRADVQRQIKALIVTAPNDLRERLRADTSLETTYPTTCSSACSGVSR
ncbi:IS110 family transposase [Microtetraspora malaysiensis]|uniref:Transposase n=1 Tax=Microtetraspora malaysiensis TaxID=161358 RepID=A0ABW6SU09_9ACTN